MTPDTMETNEHKTMKKINTKEPVIKNSFFRFKVKRILNAPKNYILKNIVPSV